MLKNCYEHVKCDEKKKNFQWTQAPSRLLLLCDKVCYDREKVGGFYHPQPLFTKKKKNDPWGKGNGRQIDS